MANLTAYNNQENGLQYTNKKQQKLPVYMKQIYMKVYWYIGSRYTVHEGILVYMKQIEKGIPCL